MVRLMTAVTAALPLDGGTITLTGLLETADLVDTAGLIKDVRVRALGWKKRVDPYLLSAGAGPHEGQGQRTHVCSRPAATGGAG